MTSLKNIRIRDLPEALRANVDENLFLRGCLALSPGNYVVWLKSDTLKPDELEWSSEKGRFLSRDERELLLAHDAQLDIPELDVRAVVKQFLSLPSNILYEAFEVYRRFDDKPVIEVKQYVYSPVRETPLRLIRSKLKSIDFPNEYAGWSLEEKIKYWTYTLYRFRHQVGEQGLSEDAAFDSDMVVKMRSIDPNVVHILPAILCSLANMENVDPQKMLKSFSQRTGLTVE